jgi:hypothetical protein
MKPVPSRPACLTESRVVIRANDEEIVSQAPDSVLRFASRVFYFTGLLILAGMLLVASVGTPSNTLPS